VRVLDTGARAASTTFGQRNIGDVLLAWENEAFLSLQELGKDKVEIVVPSMSILAEPPVAVVDKVVLKRGTRDLATEYVKHLYSPAAQEIIARNFYRPIDAQVAQKYSKQFPKLKLVTIQDFGGWAKAQKVHFGDGGIFEQIFEQ
jgi:sulfate transport system substrate-binding protein